MTRPPLAPDDPRHGTANGYSNWRCRCQPCRDAVNTYRKAYHTAWRRRNGVLPWAERVALRAAKCGTPGGYSRHRRDGETPCDACREAATVQRRRYRGDISREEYVAQHLAPCGTRAAYKRHLRYGEPTCQPCRDAEAARGRRRNAAK